MENQRLILAKKASILAYFVKLTISQLHSSAVLSIELAEMRTNSAIFMNVFSNLREGGLSSLSSTCPAMFSFVLLVL